MGCLTKSQKSYFWENGYLLVKDAVDSKLLNALQNQFSTWVEHSRKFSCAYGKTIDGRARYDLEPGHTSEKPGLRRVNAPVDVSTAYFKAMSISHMTDCVAELIGPNVKYHHSKINSKLPGGNTAVKWHQDFPFTPHSNDDLITALLMLDEVTDQNGPLQVLPGSHRGELYDLWHKGVFTGAIDEQVADQCMRNARVCTGSAGSVCLMHTRLLHGSAANFSDKPRTLFICVYSAEDAIAYSANPVPSKHEGLVVSGEKTHCVRSVDYEMRLPEKPKSASFFDQQAKHT